MMKRPLIAAATVLFLGFVGFSLSSGQASKEQKKPREEELPIPREADDQSSVPNRLSVAVGPMTPIDLVVALRLAGVENPEILLARQRVVEAVAIRQEAAAMLLPNLNAGVNYDDHTGPLQQASGNILKVNRQALYLGAGANAVAAGTVSIPGVVYNLNTADAFFRLLISRQIVAERRFASDAAQIEGLRRVGQAYYELLRAEAIRTVSIQTREQAKEVADLTSTYAKSGQGRLGDAHRAATELDRRDIDVLDSQARIQVASARLAELLNLDPVIRLAPAEKVLVPMPLVPDPIPLSELLAIALMQRPELAERQAVIRQAMFALANARWLPFSPNFIVGFSAGTFGGGSNLIANNAAAFGLPSNQTLFSNFRDRNDFDVVAFWTLQNLGVGNRVLVRGQEFKLRSTELEQLEVLNRVRAEVANAYILIHTRFAQIAATEAALRSGLRAYREDLDRIRNNVRGALPIELLASLQLLGQARNEFVDAIVGYNEAQLNLYAALGQPPADALARPEPIDGTHRRR